INKQIQSDRSTLPFVIKFSTQFVFNKMKQELDVTPLLERELLDEKSRVAGEIDYVLSSARIRNLSIPDEILTRIDTQLEL
ncbi:MAG: hypothetical protein ACFFEL_13820, partial [Candidatus Thorarchaeota archaeon]